MFNLFCEYRLIHHAAQSVEVLPKAARANGANLREYLSVSDKEQMGDEEKKEEKQRRLEQAIAFTKLDKENMGERFLVARTTMSLLEAQSQDIASQLRDQNSRLSTDAQLTERLKKSQEHVSSRKSELANLLEALEKQQKDSEGGIIDKTKALWGKTLDKVGWDKISPDTKNRMKAGAVAVGTVLGVIALWRMGKWLFGNTRKLAKSTANATRKGAITLTMLLALAIASTATFFGYRRLQKAIDGGIGKLNAAKEKYEEKYEATKGAAVSAVDRRVTEVEENLKRQREIARLAMQKEKLRSGVVKWAHDNNVEVSAMTTEDLMKQFQDSNPDSDITQNPDIFDEDFFDVAKKEIVILETAKKIGNIASIHGLLFLYPLPDGVAHSNFFDVLVLNEKRSVGELLANITNDGKSVSLARGNIAILDWGSGSHVKAAGHLIHICYQQKKLIQSLHPNDPEFSDENINKKRLKDYTPLIASGLGSLHSVIEHLKDNSGDLRKSLSSFDIKEIIRDTGDLDVNARKLYREQLGLSAEEAESLSAWDLLKGIEDANLAKMSLNGYLEYSSKKLSSGKKLTQNEHVLQYACEQMQLDDAVRFVHLLFHGHSPYSGYSTKTVAETGRLLADRVPVSMIARLYLYWKLSENRNAAGLLLGQLDVAKYFIRPPYQMGLGESLSHGFRTGRFMGDVSGLAQYGSWNEFMGQLRDANIDMPPQAKEMGYKFAQVLLKAGVRSVSSSAAFACAIISGCFGFAWERSRLVGSTVLGTGAAVMGWKRSPLQTIRKDVIKDALRAWHSNAVKYSKPVKPVRSALETVHLAYKKEDLNVARQCYGSIYDAWEKTGSFSNELSDAINRAVRNSENPNEWLKVARVLDSIDTDAAKDARKLASNAKARHIVNHARYFSKSWTKKAPLFLGRNIDRYVYTPAKRFIGWMPDEVEAGRIINDARWKKILSEFGGSVRPEDVGPFLELARDAGKINLDKPTLALIQESQEARRIIVGAVNTLDVDEVTHALSAARKAAKWRVGLNAVGVVGDVFGMLMAYAALEELEGKKGATTNPALQELYAKSEFINDLDYDASATALVIGGTVIVKSLVAGKGLLAAAGAYSSGIVMLPVAAVGLGVVARNEVDAMSEKWLKEEKDYTGKSAIELLTDVCELRRGQVGVGEKVVVGTSMAERANAGQRFLATRAYLMKIASTTLSPKQKNESQEEYEQRSAQFITDQVSFIYSNGNSGSDYPKLYRMARAHAELLAKSRQLDEGSQSEVITVEDYEGNPITVDIRNYAKLLVKASRSEKIGQEQIIAYHEMQQRARKLLSLTIQLKSKKNGLSNLEKKNSIHQMLVLDCQDELRMLDARIGRFDFKGMSDNETAAEDLARLQMSRRFLEALQKETTSLFEKGTRKVVSLDDYEMSVSRLRKLLGGVAVKVQTAVEGVSNVEKTAYENREFLHNNRPNKNFTRNHVAAIPLEVTYFLPQELAEEKAQKKEVKQKSSQEIAMLRKREAEVNYLPKIGAVKIVDLYKISIGGKLSENLFAKFVDGKWEVTFGYFGPRKKWNDPSRVRASGFGTAVNKKYDAVIHELARINRIGE